MTGIRSLFALLLCAGVWFTGLALQSPGQAQDEHSQPDRAAGLSDCSFTNRPDEFLGREAQVRREIDGRTRTLLRSASARGAPPVAASSLPVRNFIDEEIFARLTEAKAPAARLSTDEEFLRRLSFDLTGRPPSPDDVRAFLADSSESKRDELIERLLYSQEFTERWTMWMGDWLQVTATLSTAAIQRQIGGRNAFFAWLGDAVYSEKSLKDIAFECITGSGNNYDAKTGNANFPIAGSTAMGPIQDTYDMILSKAASTFLGLSHYDCLLCHNGRGHLDLLSAWGSTVTRMEAQRMAAFFSRTRLSRNPEPDRTAFYFNSTLVSDAPAGAYDLNTNFGNRPNRAPAGTLRNLTPEYRLGGAPASANWRFEFAESLHRDPMFARNLANRLWKQMFGLALAEPLDGLDPARLDPDHPPEAPWTFQATHPQLLERLAREFAGLNYQLRPFLRLLAQSTAYQLSSRYDGEWNIQYVPLFARHYPRRLEAEEVHDSIVKATQNFPAYRPQGWAEPLRWAMQLPDTLEGDRGFMDVFFRGNRDTLPRSQSGSIQQQLNLMNHPFVTNRVNVNNSPKLRAVARLTDSEEILNELYLTFLSRYPSPYEKAKGVPFLARATTQAARNAAVEDTAWALINKVEFLFSY